MSEQTPRTETPKNLKGIYQQLQEIDEVLSSPRSSLDTLVNGDKSISINTSEKKDTSDSMPSMDNLASVIESIHRKSNEISKITNRLVGN